MGGDGGCQTLVVCNKLFISSINFLLSISDHDLHTLNTLGRLQISRVCNFHSIQNYTHNQTNSWTDVNNTSYKLYARTL